MSSLTQITAPFHNANLLVVEQNNEPYTPMKPIVEGIGLAWNAQYIKLKQRFSSVIMEIITTGKDGKQYEMVCLPLRKLFGWLMTISPNKVKPELRETVIKYQNECDDVLWDYWTKGIAVKSQVNSCNKISSEQAGTLYNIVHSRANGNSGLIAQMWSRLKSHFKYTASYRELHAVHFEDAKQYLETMQLRQPKLIQDDKTIFSELEQTTTDQVMSYIFSLMGEVNRLNGRMPKPLDFDDELMTRAVVNDRMAGKRMFLTFNARTSQPEVKFIGNDMVVVNKDNIQKVIGDSNQIPTKALPGVIEAVAKRMK